GKFSEVKDCEKFFVEGTTPNLPGPETLQTDLPEVQEQLQVCNSLRHDQQIPVFSAYTFTGAPPKGRPDQSWMNEPQLNNNPEMMVDHQYQAENNDYMYSKEKGVNRGHLFPSSHAHDLETQESTFTLTNIVPQVVSFNRGSWNTMERSVSEMLQKDCINSRTGKINAFVVTGAEPSEHKTLNKRVNIPSLLWTAYCCYNKDQRQWVAKAHWGENQKEGEGKTLRTESLGVLENKLKKGGSVQVFPNRCPRVLNPTNTPNPSS
ncbi:unnamed protein product, partial [Coregonus sp. 'balchen']